MTCILVHSYELKFAVVALWLHLETGSYQITAFHFLDNVSNDGG